MIWTRHILNCAALASLIAPNAEVVDLGSGAGLPGLVLALARPDLTVTLVEPMARRCVFLAEVAAELELAQVRIERARAEDLAGRLSVNVAVVRALASLDKLVPMAMPLLRAPRELLALKGKGADQELSAAARVLGKFDAHGDILAIATPGSPQPTTVVRVRASLPDPQH